VLLFFVQEEKLNMRIVVVDVDDSDDAFDANA
jgi:hypothetical protein